MNIKQAPISQFNYGTKKTQKVGFVLHWIVGELETADATFKNPLRRASAHFGIGSNGEIHQYVPTDQVAYHAGDMVANQKYIGIEHAGGQMINGARKKPTDQCHQASIDLITDLCKKMGIKELIRGKNIFKHSEIKATQCCGTLDIDYITNKVNENLKPKPPEPVKEPIWKSKYGREEQEKFGYINNLNAMYLNWVETGQCNNRVADELTERDNEIKNWKVKVEDLEREIKTLKN